MKEILREIGMIARALDSITNNRIQGIRPDEGTISVLGANL